MIKRQRTSLSVLVLSAMALVGIATHEGYQGVAYVPVKGDVPTIGFGTTKDVHPGDTITPQKALERALTDIQGFEGAVKRCVKVPLYQHEYDAYISLSYNIGTGAFCSSTLVKELNLEHYAEACNQILRWDKFKGKPLRGLTIRRQAENEQCLGDGSG